MEDVKSELIEGNLLNCFLYFSCSPSKKEIVLTFFSFLFLVTCEFCGAIGMQSDFYEKNNKFCTLECSKRNAALHQRKPPPKPANLNSTNNRSNKRKIHRPGIRHKKVHTFFSLHIQSKFLHF